MSVSYKKLWEMLIDKDMSKTKRCKVLDCKIDGIIDYNEIIF